MSNLDAHQPYYAKAPVALVVGCGDVGMGCARQLGLSQPLLIIDIDGARLDREVEALRDQGYSVTGRVCDISSFEETKALGEALGDFPGVRTLAHIAAVGPTIGDWRKMMAVNLMAPHLIVNAVRPHMVRGGAAIFMSSAGGYFPAAHEARDRLLDNPLDPGFLDALVDVLGEEPSLQDTYFYAKRGLMRYARKLAALWGADEIRALSVSPGALLTTMGRRDGALTPDRIAMVRKIPLGRQGTINEVAAAVAFLASDAASYANGIDLLLDGGLSAALAQER